jgi:hypothetical protein
MKKQDADDGHDGRAARKNCRNGGERTTFLEKKKKRDRAGADADTGQQGIIKTSSTEFLIPFSRKPEDRQVDEDRQCRASFDNKTAETFADTIGCKPGKDLVRAVKHSSDDRIPEPSRHRVKSRTLSTKSNARRSYPTALLGRFCKKPFLRNSVVLGALFSAPFVTQKVSNPFQRKSTQAARLQSN